MEIRNADELGSFFGYAFSKDAIADACGIYAPRLVRKTENIRKLELSCMAASVLDTGAEKFGSAETAEKYRRACFVLGTEEKENLSLQCAVNIVSGTCPSLDAVAELYIREAGRRENEIIALVSAVFGRRPSDAEIDIAGESCGGRNFRGYSDSDSPFFESLVENCLENYLVEKGINISPEAAEEIEKNIIEGTVSGTGGIDIKIREEEKKKLDAEKEKERIAGNDSSLYAAVVSGDRSAAVRLQFGNIEYDEKNGDIRGCVLFAAAVSGSRDIFELVCRKLEEKNRLFRNLAAEGTVYGLSVSAEEYIRQQSALYPGREGDGYRACAAVIEKLRALPEKGEKLESPLQLETFFNRRFTAEEYEAAEKAFSSDAGNGDRACSDASVMPYLADIAVADTLGISGRDAHRTADEICAGNYRELREIPRPEIIKEKNRLIARTDRAPSRCR